MKKLALGRLHRMELDQHEDEIRKQLSYTVAKTAIARMHGCSWQMVHAWARRHKMQILAICRIHKYVPHRSDSLASGFLYLNY